METPKTRFWDENSHIVFTKNKKPEKKCKKRILVNPRNPIVGRSRGLHENSWKIHGKSMDKSRVLGNPNFGKKSRLENKFVVFCKVWREVPIQWHSLFDAVPGMVVPELIAWRSEEIIDFFWTPTQYWENKKKMDVSEVLWDQMSRKKGGMSPRIISHPSHLP